MAQVKWSKEAIESLKDICDYIARDSLYYSKIFRDRIFESVEHLSTFSEIGRKVPESEDLKVREIIYQGYRIIYQINDNYLEILLVIHGSRLLKL